MGLTLVLGGARSGKSRYAEATALSLSESPIYLATSRIWDEDHQRRIQRHQADRGPEWENFEEEKELSRVQAKGRVIVVDCVTLWLTNYFVDLEQNAGAALDAATAELEKLPLDDNQWIFVSNEVGMSLHAETELGRKFTDAQGLLNQRIAKKAQRVVLMVAGIPMEVKNEESE